MDKKALKQQEKHDTRVAYYNTLCTALLQSRIEMNKQLLTLSALAIGLLVTVLDDPPLRIEALIWSGACLSFLTCIIIILGVFYINGQYIEDKIDKRHEENESDTPLKNEDLDNQINKSEKSLDFLTPISSIAFGLGVILTTIFACMKFLDFFVGSLVIAFAFGILLPIVACAKYYKH